MGQRTLYHRGALEDSWEKQLRKDVRKFGQEYEKMTMCEKKFNYQSLWPLIFYVIR